MTEEITAASGAHPGADLTDQAVYQLWQQQIDRIRASRQAAEAAPAVQGPAGPGLRRDASGLDGGERRLEARVAPVDLDAVHVPDELAGLPRLGPVGQALAELGVVATLSQVAVAFTRTTFSPGEIATSLGRLAANMTEVAEQLNRLPGVGAALEVFGGVGGIVSGLSGLSQELAGVKAEGPSLGRGLGAASSAARLVGGVAMALSPFCAPLAAVGGTIALAGAALELGKLGWEGRGAAKALGARGVSHHGAAAPQGLTPIISNNGANMVQVDMKRPFAWLTG